MAVRRRDTELFEKERCCELLLGPGTALLGGTGYVAYGFWEALTPNQKKSVIDSMQADWRRWDFSCSDDAQNCWSFRCFSAPLETRENPLTFKLSPEYRSYYGKLAQKLGCG